MTIKTVNLIGLGALGMLFGHKIQNKIGNNISFVMDKDRYNRHSKDIYTINKQPIQFNLVSAENARPCDLLLIAVKYRSLEKALETAKTSIGPDTIVLSLMNGVTSEKIIAEHFPQAGVIYTVSQGMAAIHFGTTLDYREGGELHIGITKEDEKCPRLVSALNDVKTFFDSIQFPYVIEADIMHRLWGKFMMNVGLNQTCMVFGGNDGSIREPASEQFMVWVSAMREVLLIAAAEGVHLTEEDIRKNIAIIATHAPSDMPSMAQDRISKKYSEVEMFAGYIIKAGKKYGILTPTNDFLYKRVHEIEKEY